MTSKAVALYQCISSVWKELLPFLLAIGSPQVAAKIQEKRQMMQMRSLNRQDTIDIRYGIYAWMQWNEFKGGPHFSGNQFWVVSFHHVLLWNWFWFQCTKIRTQLMNYAPLCMCNKLLSTAVCLQNPEHNAFTMQSKPLLCRYTYFIVCFTFTATASTLINTQMLWLSFLVDRGLSYYLFLRWCIVNGKRFAHWL